MSLQKVLMHPILSDQRYGVRIPSDRRSPQEDSSESRGPIGRIVGLAISFSVGIHFSNSYSQYFTRTDTIPVKVSGNFLKNPWVGGLNFVQLSALDLNFDGISDLVVFDRSGHKLIPYLNQGISDSVSYIHAPQYESKFPHIEDWMLLRDFNCDGLPDIFTYAISLGGIKVWKNISSGGSIQFALQTSYIQSNYNPTVSNLYVSRVDLPTIDDIDGDGDLDVLTFNFSNTILEFHINRSQELGYGCDSLLFQLDTNGCWGNFKEDAFFCNVYLNQSCRIMNPDSMQKVFELNSTTQHPGNCSMSFDLDGDGDKEILLGQLNCCNMVMLTNGGTPSSANMVAMDSIFPSYDKPASLTAFPCGYFLDVNNDNKSDLIVSPNAPSLSINYGSVWYYKNIGTSLVPVFSRKKMSLLQDEMIDVGAGAHPAFFDFNNDGLSDILIANDRLVADSCNQSYSYNISAFQNTGTATSPVFESVSADFASTSSSLPNTPGKHLTFADLDGDGDKDMLIGDEQGFLHYFENTGSSGPANFSSPPILYYPDDTGTPIDIGSNAAPQLIDADRDGDFDLIIGEYAGNLNYFENIGTSSSPLFRFITSSFGGVDVVKPCCTGYSVPFMFDSSGSYRLIVASEANINYPPTGWLWYYKDIDGNLSGNFTLIDSMYQNIWEGARMALDGTDINNDGRMDLMIGNFSGGVTIYLGDTINKTSVHDIFSSLDFLVFPNPTSGNFQIQLVRQKDGLSQSGATGNWQLASNQQPSASIEIYNVLGENVYSEKILNPKSLILNLDLSSGIYFCTLHTEHSGKIRTKKIVIVK